MDDVDGDQGIVGDRTLDRLRGLAAEAWGLHRLANMSASRLVNPSMPILYFGDVQQYFSSALRIITVGLNPSREEFPTLDPWRRFPEGLTLDPEAPDLDAYLQSLNRYFHGDRQSYMRWFGMAFGAVLGGLDADFQGSAGNTALHTDLCSPLATDPTWSGLSQHEQQSLSAGYRLWHDLVDALSPDVILMSVAERHLGKVDLTPGGEWTVVHEVARSRPYEFRARRIEGRRPCLLVWGQAAQLPFGSVSKVDKQSAGAAIKSMLDVVLASAVDEPDTERGEVGSVQDQRRC